MASAIRKARQHAPWPVAVYESGMDRESICYVPRLRTCECAVISKWMTKA